MSSQPSPLRQMIAAAIVTLIAGCSSASDTTPRTKPPQSTQRRLQKRPTTPLTSDQARSALLAAAEVGTGWSPSKEDPSSDPVTYDPPICKRTAFARFNSNNSYLPGAQ